jgi:hypothetical protein
MTSYLKYLDQLQSDGYESWYEYDENNNCISTRTNGES